MGWALLGVVFAIFPIVAYLMGRSHSARAAAKFRMDMTWKVRGRGTDTKYQVMAVRVNSEASQILVSIPIHEPEFEDRVAEGFRKAEERCHFLNASEDEYDYRRLKR